MIKIQLIQQSIIQMTKKSKSELGSIYLNNVITILCKHIESLNNCKLINNDNEENTEEINSEKENK